MKVAIVNDMLIAVEALRRVLSMTKNIEILWVANNGAQAIEKCRMDKPDLLLMDLIMPHMDGVETTKIIMNETPCPIVIVTSSVEGNTDRVFRAMGAGALDAVNTPILNDNQDIQNFNTFLDKINRISFLITPRINPTKLISRKLSNLKNTAAEKSDANNQDVNLIVIGASSGGPQALEKILAALPDTFSVPIIIVQHVDESFAPELSNWLNSVTRLKIKLAENNEKIVNGCVYIAARNEHLILNKNKELCYSSEYSDLANKPSVNVFFKSVVKYWSGKAIGILLTGMGGDGAEGLLQLRKRGDITITQDEKSCAVFGMPKAAINLNAAMNILPLNQISSKIQFLTL